MLVTTSDVLQGQEVELLGLVSGNVVTSKHMGKDLMAGFKNMVGGEIKSYTEMMVDGRQMAEERMIAKAEALGADAIVNMRFDSSSVMEGAIDFLAYGTAVKYK